MERARTEWLRRLGVEQDALLAQNAQFVVSRITVEYHAPARFNDSLAVGVTMVRLGRASLNLQQDVRRESGVLLCGGQVRIACVTARGDGPGVMEDGLKPRAIPNNILSELQRDR